MVRIEKTTTIRAPVDEVYRYVENPEHLPEIWPSMIEVKDVRALPTGGYHFHWLYKMAGLRFEGDTDEVDHVDDQRLVTKSKGQIESTFTWSFARADGETKVDLQVDYEIPVPLVGRMAEPLLARMNEREAETVLANLKDCLEA